MWRLYEHRRQCRTYVLIIPIIAITIYLYVVITGLKKAHVPVYNTNLDNPVRNSNANVWNEVTDRIGRQLVFVPKGYKYEMTPFKRILVYNGHGVYWERIQRNQAEFLGCPVDRCWITFDRSDGPVVDAILYRHNFQRPSYKKAPNQVWIMYNTEAPFTEHNVGHEDRGVFNWTANYRWDSDIPIPYGYHVKLREPLPVGLVGSSRVNYAQKKTKLVAQFVSNCYPNSERNTYVKELSKHIAVDIYGDCGPLKCNKADLSCFEILTNYYKFYLSFENAHCRWYITEKLFRNALQYNVLPVVMGPSRADYEMVAPAHSFVHVDDFASPKELAAYLNVLDKNDTLYNEYFQWQNLGSVSIDTKFYCRLCAMLHDEERPTKYYENYNEWWTGKGICRKRPNNGI